MPPRFVKNHAFEREMEKEPDTIAFVDTTAKFVADAAWVLAPHASGYYASRIKFKGVRVYARDFFWFLIEYGSVNNAAYAPLRRALVALGLRLDEAPKK